MIESDFYATDAGRKHFAGARPQQPAHAAVLPRQKADPLRVPRLQISSPRSGTASRRCARRRAPARRTPRPTPGSLLLPRADMQLRWRAAADANPHGLARTPHTVPDLPPSASRAQSSSRSSSAGTMVSRRPYITGSPVRLHSARTREDAVGNDDLRGLSLRGTHREGSPHTTRMRARPTCLTVLVLFAKRLPVRHGQGPPPEAHHQDGDGARAHDVWYNPGASRSSPQPPSRLPSPSRSHSPPSHGSQKDDLGMDRAVEEVKYRM